MVIDNSLSVKLRWTQFICAIVVVSDHAFDYIHYVHQEKYIVDNIFFYLIYMFTSGLTHIAMPMFFCISAFLLYKDWNDSTSIIQRYLYKLKSRSVSILSPYLVWNTIWMCAFIIVGLSLPTNILSNNIDTHLTINNFIDGVFFAKYNEVFWFMKALIVFVLLYPIIGIIVHRGGITTLVVVGTLCCLSSNYNGLGFFTIFFNSFWWFMGTYISINYLKCLKLLEKEKINKYIWFLSLSVALWGISLYSLNASDIILRFNTYSIKIVLLLCNIVGCYSFWHLMDYFVVIKIKPEWLLKVSFLLYALHKPIMQLWNKLIAKICGGVGNIYIYSINVLGGVLFTVLVIVTVIYTMRKFTPKLLKVLNGGRKI